MNMPLAFLDFLGPSELLVIAVLAVLLYGERLPEVAQSLGKQFKDFRNSLQGIQNEFRAAATSANNALQGAVSSNSSSRADEDESEVHEEATAPKFTPPPAESHGELPGKPQGDLPSESHGDPASGSHGEAAANNAASPEQTKP